MAKRSLLRFRRGKSPLFRMEQSHSTSPDWAQLDGKQPRLQRRTWGSWRTTWCTQAQNVLAVYVVLLSKKEANRSGEAIPPLFLPLGTPCLQHFIQFYDTGTHEQASGGHRKVEHFTHERRLIELGLLSLRKKSVNSCNYLVGACREHGAKFFSEVHSDKIKGGGHKLHF